MQTIESKLRDIVAEQFGIPHEDITLKTKLSELGDSLDHVELIMAIDEEFNTDISDEQAEKFVLFGDIVTYLESLE